MKHLLLISVLLASLAGQAKSQSTPEACAAVDDGGARLLCYDALFRFKIEATSPAASSNLDSQWSIQTEKNRITDTSDVYVSVDSEQVVPPRFGGQGSKANLMLRCKENTTSLTVWFGGQFMADSGGYDRVTYRIDDLPAQSDRWSESTNNEHMGLWSGGRAIPMIKSMFGHDTLLLEATPFNENSVTLDFTITGIDKAVTELRKTCGW